MYNHKKRLLIFHPTIAPYRIDFFNSLSRAFETRICLEYKNLKSQRFDYKTITDQFEFNPIYLPKDSKLSLYKSVLHQIWEFVPDVVITCEYGLATLSSIFASIICRKEFKLVVMTDDSYDMVQGGNDFTPRHRYARRLLAHYINDFIVVEPRVQRWYKDKYGKGLYFPIIVDDVKAEKKYERLLSLSSEITHRYGLNGKKILLSVNRLVGLKNLHNVLEAFAISKTDSTLVVVGEGPERDSLETHAAKVGKEIIFTGRLEGDVLYAWYNIATVFILASYREPFGAVTNEALLAGCRVIISNKAGSSCLVNKWNGETVDPNDVKNMANAIDRQFALATVPDLQEARRSMMPVSFDDLMGNLISRLKD